MNLFDFIRFYIFMMEYIDLKIRIWDIMILKYFVFAMGFKGVGKIRLLHFKSFGILLVYHIVPWLYIWHEYNSMRIDHHTTTFLWH